MKTETIKVGDTVSIIEHPHIKSKVELIRQSEFTNKTFYVLDNGCWFQKFEIGKAK